MGLSQEIKRVQETFQLRWGCESANYMGKYWDEEKEEIREWIASAFRTAIENFRKETDGAVKEIVLPENHKPKGQQSALMDKQKLEDEWLKK